VLRLVRLGATVTGLARGAPGPDSLLALARLGDDVAAARADLADADAIREVVAAARPEVVVHLAGQSTIPLALERPRETFERTLMGTVHLMDGVAATESVRAVVSASTGHLYAETGDGAPRREDDPLGPTHPYGAAKACQELAVRAMARSVATHARAASARIGNAIGGGDRGAGRLVPGILDALAAGEPPPVRTPEHVRPWVHVLDLAEGMLLLAEALHERRTEHDAFNLGPGPGDTVTVQDMADKLAALRDGRPAPPARSAAIPWLDCSRAARELGWRPAWSLDRGLEAVVEWDRAARAGEDLRAVATRQVEAFERDAAQVASAA
jgi:CDP-glucose 4,6-dehydratase